MPAPRSLPGLPADYTSKLFVGDSVSKITDPDYRGKVLRCWANEDGDVPESIVPQHDLDRPLLRGEVGISDAKTGALSIVPESSLSLRQRNFLVGDVVKRSLLHVESGIVIDSEHEVRLTKLIVGDILPGWIPFDKLKSSLILEVKDKVIYDEWFGTIEEVVEEAVVEGKNGDSYTFVLGGAVLGPGKLVQDVMNKTFPPGFEDFNKFQKPPLPLCANPSEDVIIEVRPVLLQITWHVISQMLSIEEQDKHPEPKSLWEGEDMAKLTHYEAIFGQPPTVGSTAVFRNESDEQEYGFVPSTHLSNGYKLRALKIVDSRSTVKVRWQDGTETTEPAASLVPHHNIDDYETWPGDHVIWKGDAGEKRVAVVQKMDSYQRIAELFFPDTQEKETVSVLEIDLGGPSHHHYGVGIALPVLLCKDNLASPPEVPGIGRFETPMANMMFRDEVSQKAIALATERLYLPIQEPIKPMGDISKIDWVGEVASTELDGSVVVRLINGEMKKVSIRELQLLGDPAMMEQWEMEPNDFDDIGMPFPLAMMGGIAMGGVSMPMMPGGIPHFHGDDDEDMASGNSWETMSGQDDDGEGDIGDYVNEEYFDEEMWNRTRDVMDTASDGPINDNDEIHHPEDHAPESTDMEIDEEEQERRDVEEIDPLVSPKLSDRASLADAQQPEAGPSSPRRQSLSAEAPMENGNYSLEDDEIWQRFDMLEEAPADHHFIGELANQAGSRAYHSRLAKEHRALASSLPENILVRTYENRTDLLRVLIIGPEGTPYADAPFVFDVYLNPTKFPHEPPVVHFHSHTFGKGRCNPNLYEEGKVCLSILGTWSGEKSESWNPTKSSLLQVFVSISGLVLVRSPYHCEPAFAKLEGTREGWVNSRLYSEKAYVLSRSFVRTAIERPPAGLEKEIRHLYFQKGRLASVVEHSQRLIRKGEEQASRAINEVEEEDEQMWNADAVGSLTMGAILTLKRTINVLERILKEHDEKERGVTSE